MTGVEVDTAALERGVHQLANGCEDSIRPAAATAANTIAARLRPLIPVRSGRLRATVSVTAEPSGSSVHYGGGLPYANYIDRRTHATDQATAGAPALFGAAMHAAARAQVARL